MGRWAYDISLGTRAAAQMTIWRTKPVVDQPEVRLTHWQIIRLPDGAIYVAGYNAGEREGRVSGTLIAFDPPSRRIRTRSGRIYHLEGEQGWHGDAEYVLRHWCAINKVGADILDFIAIDGIHHLAGFE